MIFHNNDEDNLLPFAGFAARCIYLAVNWRNGETTDLMLLWEKKINKIVERLLAKKYEKLKKLEDKSLSFLWWHPYKSLSDTFFLLPNKPDAWVSSMMRYQVSGIYSEEGILKDEKWEWIEGYSWAIMLSNLPSIPEHKTLCGEECRTSDRNKNPTLPPKQVSCATPLTSYNIFNIYNVGFLITTSYYV